MKKSVMQFATLFFSVFLLVGCETGDNSTTGEDEVTIELWTTPQFQGVFSPDEDGADYDSFFREAAERYTEENPNVNIDIQIIPGDDRDSELSVALQTDTLPDIFFDSHFVLSQWAHEGVLSPLDDVINEDTLNDIPESIWENVRINDEIYMYPFNHNLGTLVYNADMFREAGLEEYIGEENDYAQWTVEEFDEILQELSENLDGSISPMGLYALNEQGDTWNLNWLRMHGNDFWSDEGELIVNQDDGIESAEQLLEWYQNGYTNQGPESVSSNDVNAMFQNQQLAISFANTVQYNTMLGEMERGSVENFDARLALNPSAVNDQIAFTYVLSSVVFGTSDEQQIEAAKDFVNFYSSNEELIMASAQGVPVRDSVTAQLEPEDNIFLEANQELTGEVYDFSNNAPGYSQLRNALYPELQSIYTGSKTPEEALNSYVEEGSQIIENAVESSQILE